MAMSPKPSVDWPEPPELALTQAMADAAAAMRRTLAGMAPGSTLVLADVASAFKHVERVGSLQRTLRTDTLEYDALEFGRVYSDYRSALADWERSLPRLHGWLLAERARLGSRSGHTQRLREWIAANDFLVSDSRG